MIVSRKETETLESKFNKIFHEGAGSTILVSGEDGIGKSFFINDFIEKIKEKNKYNPKLKVLSASSYCDGRYTDLYPWKELFIDLESGIASLNQWDNKGSGSEIDYKKLVRNVYEGHGADWLKLIPVVGNYASELLKTIKTITKESEAQKAAQNIMQPNHNISLNNHADIFVQLMSKFRKLTEDQILILFIKDIQFFDTSSLDLFYNLSKNLTENPYRLLLIGSYCEGDLINKKLNATTGAIEAHPVDVALSNLKKSGSYEDIALKRFDRKQIEEFFSIKFPKNEYTPEFIEAIENITNGNAFFLEEVVKNFKETGCIYEEAGIYKNKSSFDAVIPGNIKEMIEIRYNCLSDELKTVLDIASVMGDDFSGEIISEILKEDMMIFHRKIKKLKDDYEIIINAEKNYAKLTKIYRYIHDLFRRFVYNNLIEDEMNIYHHANVAKTLKKFFEGEKINQVLEQYNYHLGVAHRITNSNGKVVLEKENLNDEESKIKTEEYVQTCKTLIEGYEKTFSNAETIKRCSIIIDIARILENKDLEFEYLQKKADVLQIIGKWNESEKDLKNALKLSEELNDKVKLANSKICLGNLMHKKGNYDEALIYLNESLKMFEELNDKSGIARNLVTIGNILKFKGNYNEAITNYENALKIRNESGDKRGVSVVTMNLGNIYFEKSEYNNAEACYKDALAIYNDLNISRSIPEVITNIGNIFFVKGKYSEASKHYRQAFAGYEESGNKKGIAQTLTNIGVINYYQRNFDESLKKYNEALRIYQELGEKKDSAGCLRNLGLVYFEMRDYGKAMENYVKANTINEQLESKIEIALCQSDIGELYRVKKEYEKAIECFDKAISIGRELNESYNLCQFFYRKAFALFQSDKLKESKNSNDEAFEIAGKIDRKDILFKSLMLSSKLLSSSDKVKSKEVLEKMLNDFSDETHIAAINYELFKLDGTEESRKKSLEIYSKLYERSTDANSAENYKKIIDELSLRK